MSETKNNYSEEELKELFTKQLKKQYDIGLLTGIKVASQMILDTLEDSSKKFSERLNSVKHFCKTSVSNENFISGQK